MKGELSLPGSTAPKRSKPKQAADPRPFGARSLARSYQQPRSSQSLATASIVARRWYRLAASGPRFARFSRPPPPSELSLASGLSLLRADPTSSDRPRSTMLLLLPSLTRLTRLGKRWMRSTSIDGRRWPCWTSSRPRGKAEGSRGRMRMWVSRSESWEPESQG